MISPRRKQMVTLLLSLMMIRLGVVQGLLASDFYRLRGPLIFQEEFYTLNTSRWEHIITAWRGGNNESQYYSNRPENSFVQDGILYLRPTLTADRFGEDFLYNGTLDLRPEGCNVNYNGGCVAYAGEDIINPIQSARIRTIHSFSFVYGTVEIRAKMPRGDWIWPAIWLMPTGNTFGPWPRSGEIDMVEIRANDNFACKGKHMGNKLMSSTLHFGPDPKRNVWRPTHYEAMLEEGDFSSDFHIYGLQRLPDSIRFFVDGIPIGEVKPPPGGFWELGGFNQEPSASNIWANGSAMTPFDYPDEKMYMMFHFILNVAVAGNFFPDGCINRRFRKPWSSKAKVQMRPLWETRGQWYPTWMRGPGISNALQVDYIRVYELPTSWHDGVHKEDTFVSNSLIDFN